MKIFSFILLLISIVFIFSCKKEPEINFKTSKAISIDRAAFNSRIISKLSDSIRVIALHTYSCPGTNALGCQSDDRPTPTCAQQVTCPPPSQAAKYHPSPCEYGSIAFGCFEGAPIGGPGCNTPVNCQTPPP